ncbi:MAG: RluA family pseudouridine synthase [Bacteriovoracaceae bacterium]
MSTGTEKSFTTDRYEVKYPVKIEHEGLRLDQFLKEQWQTLSREFLKKKIEAGEVTISGRTPPHRPSTKIHSGETITVLTFKSNYEDESWKGEKIEVKLIPDVVFEDDKLLIISKPPFMATHPAGKHLFNCATVVYETKYKKTIHSTHRLDRETSGLLVLAKDVAVAGEIQQKFEHHQVKKCYFLIAHNEKNLTEENFPIDAQERLAKGEELPEDITDLVTRLSMHCFPADSNVGKTAETIFKFMVEKKGYLILLAFPKTGRQHQIRAHAAAHGFPLLGDKLYNGDLTVFTRFKDGLTTDEDYQKMQIPRHALHSIALSFDYLGEKRLLIDQLPPDLKQWLESKLELDTTKLELTIRQKIEHDLI